jgi:hypothetical protein
MISWHRRPARRLKILAYYDRLHGMPVFKRRFTARSKAMAVIISAKILDPTHLELNQPLEASPGDVIQVLLASNTDDEMDVWRDAAKQRLLDAYSAEDAIYDEL